ncbi:DUF5131 family protein [Roseixanthobacter glucoisosaccharinicivorans]|uniref:DUF5131 family protein n=1 Tax=Roseixanthobacter glucoisosaccharinicivorans TaxID=3119923 RepID=UPI00372C75B1
MQAETVMTDATAAIEWSGRPLLAPFAWAEGRDVLVSADLFAPDIDQALHDKVFAVMALCPQHQFHLVTDFPERFQAYVHTITNDRSEWLTWRVEASFLLRDLDRGHEATGHGRSGRCKTSPWRSSGDLSIDNGRGRS